MLALITTLTHDEETISVTYLEASEKDGSHTYNDVMTGVFIDWDGDVHTSKMDMTRKMRLT